MSGVARPIEEEELHAYVDGRLSAERRLRVERYLNEHPEAAARLGAWQANDAALRTALAWKAEEPVPPSLSLARLAEARLAEARKQRAWLANPARIAATIVFALALGAGGGWFAHGPAAPIGLAAIGQEAVAVHRVFAADRVDPVEFGPDQRARMVHWTEEQFGRPVSPPDLASSGYRFIGGRRLVAGDWTGCMFLYDGADGNRVTLFIRSMRRGGEMPMQPIEAGKGFGYAWAQQGLGYSLVSSHALPGLHTLSDQVRDDLAAGA